MVKYHKLSSLWIAAVYLLICSFVANGYVEASIVENFSSPESRISVGDRSLSHDEFIEMQADRALRCRDRLMLAQQNEESVEEDSDELIAKKVYYTTH